MSNPSLRETIRSGAARCECSLEVRGFRVEERDEPYILYDGKRPSGHGKRCQWANSVAQIYYLERESERKAAR